MATVYPNTNDIVAHLPGVRAAIHAKAEEGAARARPVLAAHFYEGHSQITVTEGDRLDWFVNLDDTRGEHAAAAIEYGRRHIEGRGGPTQGVGALAAAF